MSEHRWGLQNNFFEPHRVSTAKKSLKVSPKKEPNTLQSIKSMHVNQRKYELDRIEKENLKIA